MYHIRESISYSTEKNTNKQIKNSDPHSASFELTHSGPLLSRWIQTNLLTSFVESFAVFKKTKQNFFRKKHVSYKSS